MTDLRQLYIVIAEDDEDDGELLCESFTRHTSFKKVDWVNNGKALLELLEKNEDRNPDLILTDINMPIMSGLEAAEEIFKNPRFCSIPIFVYSSANNPTYEAKCKELGCVAFLLKPFNLADYDEIPYKLVYLLKSKII
jgi:CheY-like chemotaxis protein